MKLYPILSIGEYVVLKSMLYLKLPVTKLFQSLIKVFPAIIAKMP